MLSTRLGGLSKKKKNRPIGPRFNGTRTSPTVIPVDSAILALFSQKLMQFAFMCCTLNRLMGTRTSFACFGHDKMLSLFRENLFTIRIGMQSRYTIFTLDFFVPRHSHVQTIQMNASDGTRCHLFLSERRTHALLTPEEPSMCRYMRTCPLFTVLFCHFPVR